MRSSAGRLDDQLGPMNVWCWPPVSPPSCLTFVICGESYKYRVMWNNSSVHSVVVTQSCDILVLTSSSSPATSSPFFFFPWERRTFLLDFLELFLNSPLSVFGHFSWGPAFRLAIMRTIWTEWTRAPDGLPWASIVLNAFGHFSRGLASHLTVPRTIWSEWTQSGLSPLTCYKIPLECLFRMVHVHYLLCIYCIFLHSNLIQFLFCSVKT